MNSFLEEKALLSIINTKISCGSPFPRLCAHRRASHVCPENTLPAFGSAIALGALEIERDLWMSAGGVPVACHDSSVDRPTDGEGPINEMDWADIQCLDAGIKLGLGWSGVRVPRFEEVLDAADSRAGINIHIKEPGSEGQIVKLVCDLLRARGLKQMHYIAGDEPALEVALNLCTGNPAGVSDCTERAAAYGQGCTRVAVRPQRSRRGPPPIRPPPRTDLQSVLV